MHILILEDEIPAHKKLVAHLSDFLEEPFSLDSARSVKKGIQLVENNKEYDLILSDIKLLDGISFEIFHKVETMAPIIFCTAYDEHLLEAFQTNGIAYILKPYLKEDFENALKKFQDLFHPKFYKKDLFKQLKEVLGTKKDETYKKRFAIKKRDGIKLLDAKDISLIQAKGDFCTITDVNGKLHSISKNIGTLVEQLDPKQFFKINRSQIISIEHIQKIEPYAKNRLALRISGVKEYMTTSSATTKLFRSWLEQ